MTAAAIETVRLEKITFGYGGAPVFEDLDLNLPEAPLVWLKGEPGMGKSSLLKIFAGLCIPQRGRYLINERNVLELSFHEFLPYRLSIGYGFDNNGLLNNRTLRENVLLPLMFHNRCSNEEAETRVTEWMDRFNLSKVKDARPFSVTGSQRKSAILLRALIHFPQFVVLDDAMAGLKEDGRKAFADLVEECLRRRGLRQIVYCAERELPVKTLKSKELHLSYNRKKSEAA